VIERVVRFGDGWIPNRVPLEELPEWIARLHERGAESGRGELPVSLFGLRPERDKLERAREAGVVRCVLGLPSAAPDDVRRRVDEYAELVSV
jgi:hypothetical protein